MNEPPFSTIVVVGAGLIGASVAQASRRAWPTVGVTTLDAGDDLGRVRDATLVVLAAPVRANIALLDKIQPHLSPDAIVTDTGSTKRAICAAAAENPAFVGGHPMAGAAKGGAANARADLFDGKPWILTPRSVNPGAAVAQVEAFVTGLGAVPHVMTPDLHDRLVGAVSHLPQLTASALMHVVGSLAGDAGLEVAGAGLVDSTRLAASPADIFPRIRS